MGKFFQIKIFLPTSIGLLAIAIIFASLSSIGLITGVSKERKIKEVKGEAVLVTQTPAPTMTPTPTVEIKRQPTVYKQPVEQYIAPTAIPTPTPQVFNQQASNQQTEVSVESNNNSVYEPPKDSQGILCWATASHCKYECKDADGWIDVWVDNIKFYVDSSNFTTDPEKLQYYKDEIAKRVAKLTNSCGEVKVRQWVQ
ncbi:MAG: hypothetical protein Q8P26_01950 [Candidatus Levybacteria bacterium]|nr:hypothetical protein [Candidatus Levybacteria bacterium]